MIWLPKTVTKAPNGSDQTALATTFSSKVEGRRDAEDMTIFAFSAGKILIRHENTADSVLRPQLGGLQTAVTPNLSVYRATFCNILRSVEGFSSLLNN
jgi:hypothetical protein